MKPWLTILAAALSYLAATRAQSAADSLVPYTAETVPQNVIDLWKGIDFRREPLAIEVVKEWREPGHVCRYVRFTIGHFKGAEARLAAFYTFPESALTKPVPGFVWAHGGGQRAERERGAYFARQGYATLDINWGGREMVEGIATNTDWGRVDPSQGPQFYPKALRPSTKQDLQPDAHTLDPVVSPRNGNWFLLTYAARRAITFLEQQPEVDPTKLGFTGYSMGGNITSFAAIDERLKAVVPMVGGTGFVSSPFPGIPDASAAAAYRGHAELFARTLESQSYYPHVRVPVLLLTASNDFHGTVDRAYACLQSLPHPHWRISLKMHFNHSLGAEQWILMNAWFDTYLKGEPMQLPQTAASTLQHEPGSDHAVFTVTPDQVERLRALRIYYSHDPNPQTRFWKTATDAMRDGKRWSAKLPLHEGLPLFAFADCTYALGAERESFQGKTRTFTLASMEQVRLPSVWKMEKLAQLAHSDRFDAPLERDWGDSPQGSLTTYKFRDPELRVPGAERALRVQLRDVNQRIGVRLRVTKNRFLTGVREPQRDYTANFLAQPGQQEVVVRLADFLDAEKAPMTDWHRIATLSLEVIHQGRALPLREQPLVDTVEWTAAPASSPNRR